MERVSDVVTLLFLPCLWGLCCGLQHDGCRNYRLQFERVFSVPGDVAMLNSTLLSPSVFNISTEPYNVTWYKLHSDQPISNQSGQTLVLGETLWLLNVTLADAGDYVTVVRTPRQCFRQETKLVVKLPLSPPQCGRPWTVGQPLLKGVTDHLSCPLKDHISKLQSYGVSHSITWSKGCEWISDGADRFSHWGSSLKVKRVESADEGLYTCTLHFSLDGTKVSVSETIEAEVQGDYCLLPQIREPAKDVLRAELGSKVTKRCLVFVPCEGSPPLDVDVYWHDQKQYISDEPSERVYMGEERKEWLDGGVLIERWLVISELEEQDLNLTYTCQVLNSRAPASSYFTLLPKDPELLIPVSLPIGSCLLLFLLCVAVFYVFKLELVLWFRSTFPMLYTSASDGLLYDAYVAYPQRCSPGWTDEVERFALQTLPQVLEEACGYSLFLPDRDSLPGEAVIDSLEENLKNSRRVILLYTASTFNYKYCSNNNNTLLSRPWDQTDSEDHSQASKEKLNTKEEHVNTKEEHLNTNKEQVNTKEEHVNTNKGQLNINMAHLNTSKDHLYIKEEPANTKEEHLNTSKDHLNTNKEHLRTSKDNLNNSKESLKISQEHLLNNKKRLNTSPSEGSCEHRCDHARTQLECVEAMHRALLERSLKVILVELDELGPSDLQQLPESVRHLRQSKGAVCWWRSPGTRWRTGCMRRTRRDTETELSSCLSPDCRFWKEVRYRMPVRVQRRSKPEAVALLQLHKTHNRTEKLTTLPV